MESSILFEVVTAVIVFTGVIVSLVFGLMMAGKSLQPAGKILIDVNDGNRTIEVDPGTNLLSALAEQSVFLPSACGGGGTCAMCKCHVLEGGGDILPTEKGHVTKQEEREGVRLACQLKVKQPMKIEVEPAVLDIQKFEATVISNKNVATFIKELVLKLPDGVDLNFEAGGYIQLDIPPYDINFTEFDVEEEYRGDWDHFDFWKLGHKNPEECFRAYSMANHPAEGNIVMLNVRIATAPRDKPSAPPGVASTYIFNMKPGDKVTLSGPYGEFFAKETDREMCYIGGGAGMAPMRSHLMDLLDTKNTDRKVSFWYGGRSVRELFYLEDFDRLKEEHPNFNYTIGLSEPQKGDNWTGPTGFIHTVAFENYLKNHDDPTEIEYYLCGPPMMIAAVNSMLFNLGVEPEMIAYDEFG